MTEDIPPDDNPLKYGNPKVRTVKSPDSQQQKSYEKSMNLLNRGQPNGNKKENMKTSPMGKNLNVSRFWDNDILLLINSSLLSFIIISVPFLVVYGLQISV